MYFDDSHTEVKVTDVTHCDLETKSILKPPKARAPLQEVDLGNHITVEFDVIRKRRVSFAGVNKIKEFNSEAKSFSICSTPAYEEKVSTSSDSSALSTSVSGNINNLTKENDITILDDTMDLTDLSIVQLSAMDITGIKPQKPLQGVPDIFAPRSQDSGLFSSQQDVNKPVFACEINNPNVKDGLESNLLLTKPEILNKPEDTPLVLDPRKMLLNELLEESAVDCSVDNYLKANVLFAQNTCNVQEKNCGKKKPPLDVSEMDFTQALAEPIKPESHHVPSVLEKKYLDSEKIHTKIISSNPSNLFGSLDQIYLDMDQSSRLQDNVLEYQKPLLKPKQSNMFPNFNTDESRSMKIDALQMEFTEALSSKNFDPAQNNVVVSNYIGERLLARPNNSDMEKSNPPQNMMQGHMNFNINESRPGNDNTSQMEFTEALPSKYKNVVARNYLEDKVITCHNIPQLKHSDPSQSTMQGNVISSFNINESRTTKSNNASHMEFTEALPSKNIVHQNLVVNIHSTTSILQIEQTKPFQNSMTNHMIPNFNVDESRSGNSNASQMEFTEALPFKNIVRQHLITNNHTSSCVSQTEHPNHFQKPMPNHSISNINIDESRTGNNSASQMEFTEALPSKNIACTLIANIHSTTSVSQIEQTKPFQKSMSSHAVPNFSIDESRAAKNNNASQMELTEALPSKNLAPPNCNIDGSGLAKSNNATQMELTEALPSQNVKLAHNNVIASNYIGDRLMDRCNNSYMMPEKSMLLKTNNAPEMKSTEALPSQDIDILHDIVTNNIVERSNILQMVHPNPSLKSVSSESYNVSQMEFTEALPSKKLPYNNIVTINDRENRLLAHSNDSQLEDPKTNLNSEKLKSDNYLLCQAAEGNFVCCTEKVGEISQMELTEAVPMLKINVRQSVSNFAGNSSDFHGGTSQKNVIVDRENIPLSQDLNESNSMDVTELNFADSECGTYIVNSESNAKVNINSQAIQSKSADMSLINEGDVSNMEFTGLPMNVLYSAGKTEQKLFDNFEIKKNCAFPASAVDNILENSSCMEFTSALPSNKQPGKNVMSAIQNVTPIGKDEIPNKPNILNTMNITEIDQHDIVKEIKENKNVEVYDINKLITQPRFNFQQSISKDMSLMEFTEALPVRNIQAPPARHVNFNCETSSKTTKNNVISSNYNLQTSNMEFTEVLPLFKSKQSIINSKGVHEDISPNHDILQNKIISEKNLNDSCSMDVTDVENVPARDIFKSLKGDLEISDKNKINIISTDCSDIRKLEMKEKLDDDYNQNSQNFPFLSGSQNNFMTERNTPGELQSDFSQLEFTEALPVRNELNAVKMASDVFSNENLIVNKKKSSMVSLENDSLGTSNMEFTEFLEKPDAQHFIFVSENQVKEKMKGENETQNEVISPANKENIDNLCSEDFTRTKSIVKHVIVKKSDEIYAQDSSNKHDSYQIAIQENDQVDKPQTEFLHNLEQGCNAFNLQSKPYENMFPVTNQLVNSSVDTTQMDFTDAVQPKIPLIIQENVKLKENNEVFSERRSDELVNSALDVNKIPDAYQMEFTEAITMPKYQSELHQIVKDSKVNNNHFVNKNSVENSESGSKEVLRPNVENKLDFLQPAPFDKQENISSYENESEMKNYISEDVKIGGIDQIQKLDNTCFKVYSQSKSSVEKIVGNSSTKICQNIDVLGIELGPPIHSNIEFSNTDKVNENSVIIPSHMISLDKGNSQELSKSNKLKYESVSSTQNLEVVSPVHVDEPSMSIIDRKDNKVNSLRKIFENDSKSDSLIADINTPKGKQFLTIRSAKGSSCESSNKSVVETLAVDDANQKKNLVHFNTPPVRIIKRRKTMGPLNPEDSAQLFQSNASDLASPLHDVSTALNYQNASQRRGIFDEEKKSAYDPEKVKEEWNRLVKNDAFMKERSFHFVSPCKWKYEFRWPMELVLEIPNIEVRENSRKKNLSLVTNISESDHISVFIHNRMKRNMSVILSEKWLNSHCKTIKDLLFTIKFVEEEYNKLEPLISSMKYFYQEFPFDFSSDRIIFKVVNLRKEFCFEVKIDVSYGQVKGKNIDVINHVGQISKTKVQQLFDQLQPNTERFYLFWQKLMKIHEL